MIQTSYVPLEHPYRIISYNATLGIQIGTLIVTREKESKDGDYAIETHSHPVVSYVNNRKTKQTENPFASIVNEQVEGVVWDKVEVGQVKTLMRENEELEWEDFMDYCRDCKMKSLRKSNFSYNFNIAYSLTRLIEWGLNIKYPEVQQDGELILKVELYDLLKGAKAYCIGRGGLGIATVSNGKDEMFQEIIRQIVIYKFFMGLYINFSKFTVVFSTKEKKYKSLVESLNNITDYESTSFFKKDCKIKEKYVATYTFNIKDDGQHNFVLEEIVEP